MMSGDTLGKDRFQKIILSVLSYKANGTRQQLYETRAGGGAVRVLMGSTCSTSTSRYGKSEYQLLVWKPQPGANFTQYLTIVLTD